MPKSSTGHAVMRVFITFLGVAFILWGVGRVALGFVGERGTALITNVRRQGGERSDVKSGRYNYSVSYTFKMPDGRSIDSSVTRVFSGIYVKKPNVTVPVRYLKSYPGINALEEDTKPNLSQLVLIASGGFLIFAMNRRKARHRFKLMHHPQP